MPYVTGKSMLSAARAGGCAIGAFNIENMEMAQAVICAAAQMRVPVILQTTPSTLRYATPGTFRAIVSSLAETAEIPVALHLDHGNSHDSAMRAIADGYTSVMIDGSMLSFEENIELTRRVVKDAGEIPVEAELGKVGGKEDDLDGGAGGYTDPDEAAEFVLRTGISSLAVAIGTAHGVYEGIPVLDVSRLKKIRERVSVPLVLHGASGLTDTQIRECVMAGVCKVNFATELRQAFTQGVREALTDGVYDPKKYGAAGRERVKQLVMNRIGVLTGDSRNFCSAT